MDALSEYVAKIKASAGAVFLCWLEWDALQSEGLRIYSAQICLFPDEMPPWYRQ